MAAACDKHRSSRRTAAYSQVIVARGTAWRRSVWGGACIHRKALNAGSLVLLGAHAPTRPRAACRPCMQGLAWTDRRHAEGGLATRRDCGCPRHSLGEQADWTHFLTLNPKGAHLLAPYSLPYLSLHASQRLRRLVGSSCVRRDLHGASHTKTPADIPVERIAVGAASRCAPHRDGHWPALRLALRRIKGNGDHMEWPVRARASTALVRTSPEGPSSYPTWRPPPPTPPTPRPQALSPRSARRLGAPGHGCFTGWSAHASGVGPWYAAHTSAPTSPAAPRARSAPRLAVHRPGTGWRQRLHLRRSGTRCCTTL